MLSRLLCVDGDDPVARTAGFPGHALPSSERCCRCRDRFPVRHFNDFSDAVDDVRSLWSSSPEQLTGHRCRDLIEARMRRTGLEAPLVLSVLIGAIMPLEIQDLGVQK